MPRRPCLTVGDDDCDIRGFTNTHIQAALDRVFLLGGGEVVLSAGTFALADAVHLRAGVTLRGQGDATVLRKNDRKASRITAVLGYGHTDLHVAEPDAFELGEGVLLRDEKAYGFYQTCSTLVGREGDVWQVSRAHRHDYRPADEAVAETLFPMVSAYDVADAGVADLAIDGNAEGNPVRMGGCRGGGVFAMRSDRLRLGGVTVRNANTEGIGFQTCDDVDIADCVVTDCAGNGFHPGSGSNRFHIRGCTARRCGASGLFYCLRVRDSLLEDCTFEANAGHGVSTGGRDSGNVNRGLAIRDNGGCGFFFRGPGGPDAPDRNVIEGCTFAGNAAGEGEAEILVQGAVAGTRIVGNTFQPREGVPAVRLAEDVRDCHLADNAPPDAVVDDRRGKRP